MSNLEQVIRELSANFAREIVAALKSASLDDIAVEERSLRGARAKMRAGASKPRHRRSEDEIKKLANKIVSVIGQHRNGISAEELKTILRLPSGRVSQKVIAKPIALALATKRVRKKGTRRSTRYYAT